MTRLLLRESRDDAIVLDVVARGEHADDRNDAHHARDAGNHDDRDGAEGQCGRERWSEGDGGEGGGCDAGAGDILDFATARAEVAPIPPRGELRAKRRADANQLQSVGSRARPMLLVETRTKVPRYESLALFDRLPALLERREIPAPAVMADDPEPSFVGVEREPTTDRKVLDTLIRAELLRTEQARGVHRDEALCLMSPTLPATPAHLVRRIDRVDATAQWRVSLESSVGFVPALIFPQ